MARRPDTGGFSGARPGRGRPPGPPASCMGDPLRIVKCPQVDCAGCSRPSPASWPRGCLGTGGASLPPPAPLSPRGGPGPCSGVGALLRVGGGTARVPARLRLRRGVGEAPPKGGPGSGGPGTWASRPSCPAFRPRFSPSVRRGREPGPWWAAPARWAPLPPQIPRLRAGGGRKGRWVTSAAFSAGGAPRGPRGYPRGPGGGRAPPIGPPVFVY
jgi:hypothetical protein